MAVNLFDHPYAAAVNLDESDTEKHSETDINFEDSPRKVLVQANNGGTLNILNEIVQNQDFSCLTKTKDGLNENGFHIESNSTSSDEMEVDKANSENKDEEKCLEQEENTENCSEEKTVPLEKDENESSKEGKYTDSQVKEVTQDKDKLEISDTDSSKVLDIFLGITNVFDEKELEQKSNLNGIHDEESSDKDLVEAQDKDKNETGEHNEEKQESETIDENESSEKNEPVALDSEQGAEEMDTSANDTVDYEEETDDADEGDFDNSNCLENSTDLTSEIKSGVGNGIVVSVMKRKRKRRGKRKSTCWTRPSPYKIRRVSSGSPKRTSVDGTISKKIYAQNTEDEDGDFNEDDNVNEEDASVKSVGTETQEEDSLQADEKIVSHTKGETSQSDEQEGRDDRLRRRRSRTPGNKEGFVVGDEMLKEVDIIDAAEIERGYQKKKSLLFHRGKKASPAQIKPLTPEEAEKYSEPFRNGWKREVVLRSVYEGRTISGTPKRPPSDVYYFPPVGSKIRSMVQITDWLNSHNTSLTPDNFTFMRRAIGVEGEMVRNASQSRGKASVDAAHKKRKIRFMKDTHVHDDNDGQYDKPEVVIERDSDDFLAPIISAVNKHSSPKREVKLSPKPPSKDKEMSNIPNLDELKNEKVEMIHPSNEEVIISPSKKKEHKATARKSTTQKAFKKPIPYTGIENLCSLKCPGMECIPPMLHCNICMCLFHNECVNYYGQDADFICLRCTDLQLPSGGGGPVTSVEGNVMKVNIPSLLSQLKASTPKPEPNTVRVYPVAVANASPIVSSPGLNTNIKRNRIKAATPPNSMLPLYKMLPMLAGSPRPSLPSVNSPYNYPVLLTQNTAALNSSSSPSSSSSSKSPFMLYPPLTLKSQSVSSAPSVTAKSPALADMINSKVQSDYSEIKPYIKQEPVDDSYQDAIKDTKNSPKPPNTTKASSEALDNLKNVLSSRLGSPLSADRNVPDSKSKPSVMKTNPLPLQTFSQLPGSVRMLNSMNPNFLSNTCQLTLSQNLNQPRMAFNLTSPTQGQFLPNQEFRIVPIGPPVPLSKIQGQMPLLQGKNFLPMTSPPARQLVNLSPQVTQRSENTVRTSVSVSTQEETGAFEGTGPLVVNAKSVTPMNGQLLTLPPPVVKKLTLNKPLALKINNRQITVPPSGFFPSSEGLKVFLPPNTFPTADENIVSVSVSNEKSTEDQTVTLSKSSAGNSGAEPQKSAEQDSSPKKDNVNKICDKPELVKEVKSEKTTDIMKNKFYGRCCLIQRLYGGYDCMFHIFKFLELKHLVRMNQVCKTWRRITLSPDLWTDVCFSDTRVSDWGKALRYISRRDVQSVSLKELSHFEEPNRTWHQLVSSLHELSMLKKISFGLVPAAVLQSVAGKLTQLESFIAESVSDFTDDSMWDVPTKIDVGNFRCMSELKELKLRGTGGLSMPSFSFGCGFSDLGKLTKLQKLHLTSLRNLEGSDFNFISNLTHLKDLALGDCEKWTQETYSHLQQLTSLQRLRLENGGEIPDTGLGLALSHLSQLDTLELKKYTVAYTFGNHIGGLTKLQHLSIFPTNMHYMGEVNTNTLKAVENLTQLNTLEWIIQNTSSSSIILDDNDNTETDESMEEKQHWIPFQTANVMELSGGNRNSAIQYTSVQQLKEKLNKALPDTKVKVCTARTERKLT